MTRTIRTNLARCAVALGLAHAAPDCARAQARAQSPAPAARPVRPQPAPEPAAALPTTRDEVLARASAFLNGLGSASTDFAQTNANGTRLTGRFYLSRPGRLRFDYDPPAALEVVADGTNVVVRDRGLKTSNVYPIGQTPLGFLLGPDLDLARDLAVTGVSRAAGCTWIGFDSPSTFVGTSKVSLCFDDTVARLLQWRVADAQGAVTTVTLGPLDRSPATDARLFDLRYQSVR